MPTNFQAQAFTGSYGHALPYRILMPTQRQEKPQTGERDHERVPLVLLLHGAGERGSDNTVQLGNGAANLLGPQTMSRFPCFFVLPQCPMAQRWVEVDWTAPHHVLTPQPSAPLATTMELLDLLLTRHPIDEQRIYLIGLSMGGFGVWDLLSRFPERFAAATPICGGADENAVITARTVPIWAFHGALDSEVPVQRSRRVVAALRAVGAAPRYTEYAEVGHDAWAHAFAEPAFVPWLFAHRRPTVHKPSGIA